METAVAAEGGDAFVPKPVHFRLLSAYEACFQDGIPPTDGVIAKRLGVRRETINRWRRRKGTSHRLDLTKASVRDSVGGVSNNEHLRQLYKLLGS